MVRTIELSSPCLPSDIRLSAFISGSIANYCIFYKYIILHPTLQGENL